MGLFTSLTLLFIKDTHAYYNSVTDPVQIFNGKVGNFKPRIDSFYIKEITPPKYTNLITNTLYLSPGNNNKNLDQVCITETDDISTCEGKWKPINTANNYYDYTFSDTNTEGVKTIFGFVKDRYGNKSLSSTDTITYDVTPPTVTYSPGQGTYTGNQTITITVNDSLSGVGSWGVNVTKDGVIDSTKSNTNLAGQTSFTVNLEEGSTWTIYAIVYDKAGNRQNTQPVTAEGWYYQNYTIQSNGGENLKTLQSTTSGNYLKEAYAGDELLRYIGKYNEITKNYVCFGTSNVETCKNSPDTYMYRIIGIQKSDNDTLGLKANQLKIIKATPVKESNNVKNIAWSENYGTDINWDDEGNTVRPYLNTTFLSTIAAEWQKIISNPKWYIGDNGSADSTTTEVKTPSTGKYQVGLMYASDYYNSWTYATNKDSWLHITHGTSSSSSSYGSTYEWTMTRYGWDSYVGIYNAWYVYSDGYLYDNFVYVAYAVRPVFYLSSNIKLSGSGTEESPFIITFT